MSKNPGDFSLSCSKSLWPKWCPHAFMKEDSAFPSPATKENAVWLALAQLTWKQQPSNPPSKLCTSHAVHQPGRNFHKVRHRQMNNRRIRRYATLLETMALHFWLVVVDETTEVAWLLSLLGLNDVKCLQPHLKQILEWDRSDGVHFTAARWVQTKEWKMTCGRQMIPWTRTLPKYAVLCCREKLVPCNACFTQEWIATSFWSFFHEEHHPSEALPRSHEPGISYLNITRFHHTSTSRDTYRIWRAPTELAVPDRMVFSSWLGTSIDRPQLCIFSTLRDVIRSSSLKLPNLRRDEWGTTFSNNLCRSLSFQYFGM